METILNPVNDGQGAVVEPQDTGDVTSAVAEGGEQASQEPKQEPGQGGDPKPAEELAKPQQSQETNARYAEARRQAETEARQIRAQNDRLLQALNAFGYQGSAEDISDALMAQMNNITVEDARNQRQTREKEDEERQKLQTEADFYKKIAIEKMMADDLAVIQKQYPEVKTLQELGDEFFGILQTGKVNPVTAYEIIKAQQERDKKPVPPDVGAVNNASSKEKDYYTPDEVDKLSSKDLDNPKIMEKVLGSMTKWKGR